MKLRDLTEHVPDDPKGIGHTFTAADEYDDVRAYVKWDGCLELSREFNKGAAEPDVDSLHICDISGFIEFLEALREEARRRYPEWRDL